MTCPCCVKHPVTHRARITSPGLEAKSVRGRWLYRCDRCTEQLRKFHRAAWVERWAGAPADAVEAVELPA